MEAQERQVETWDEILDKQHKDYEIKKKEYSQKQEKLFTEMTPSCQESCKEDIKKCFESCLKRCEEDNYDKDLLDVWNKGECKAFCEVNKVLCYCEDKQAEMKEAGR